MSKLYDFDETELADYLGRHVAGFDGLDGFEKFSDGQSNPSFLLRSGARKFVLRAKPPGKLLPSAHAVDREFRIMSALAGSRVAVPKMYHLSAQDSPLGVMFFVMEFVEGRILWDPALPDLSQDARRAHYHAMVDQMADLHSVDPGARGLADYGKPGNYFARQTQRWIQQYRASVLDPNKDVDFMIGYLAEQFKEDDQTAAIVHGDYRMDNMIFAPDRAEIRALLDWELSTLGNPLADLAYQCMQLRFPHAGLVKGLKGLDRGALGIPSETDYVARYCARRGINGIENWTLYLVFSYFRMIAILEGVLRRAVDGNASNPASLNMMRMSKALLAHDGRALIGT